jgi:hypothetical protein
MWEFDEYSDIRAYLRFCEHVFPTSLSNFTDDIDHAVDILLYKTASHLLQILETVPQIPTLHPSEESLSKC